MDVKGSRFPDAFAGDDLCRLFRRRGGEEAPQTLLDADRLEEIKPKE